MNTAVSYTDLFC